MTTDKSNWSGKELFEFYTSEEGEYKNTLLQAYVQIGDDIYSMLEKAEKQGKKIALVEQKKGVDDPPLSIEIQ